MKPHSAPFARRVALAFSLAAPLWLAACNQTSETPDHSVPVNTADLSPGNVENAARMAPADGLAGNMADADKGEHGARAVLGGWAHGLETGNWEGARKQWGHDGRDSGLTPEDFAEQWERYQALGITVGQGTLDGAAGSSYYSAPVTVDGTLRDGRVQHLTGTVTLRRSNDVDGASAGDLAWHISSSDLKPTP